MSGVAVVLPLLLLGHLEPLGARAPFIEGGQVVGGSTSWGLVVVDDDGAARRVCEESTGSPASQHLPLGDDVVLAVAGGQLLRTTDRGCSWGGVQLPPGTDVHDVERDHAGRVWAAAGSAGHPSGLLVSTDGGRSFGPTAVWSGPSPLFDVAVGDAGGQAVVWASGHDIDLEGPWAVVVVGEGPATVFAGDVSRFETLRAVGVDVDGRGLAVGVLSSGRSELLALGPGADGPVVSLGEVPLPATHIVSLGAATDPASDVYAIVTPGQLWHREGGAFVAVDGVRARCVATVPGDDALWLCGHTTGALAGVHFARTLDGGATFEIALRDDEITERRCPADTVGGSVCARYLEEEPPPPPEEPGESPPTTPGDPDDGEDDQPAPPGDPGLTPGEVPTDGGCNAVAGGPFGLLLLALGRRRRR